MSEKEPLIESLDLAYRDFRSVLEGVEDHDFEKIWLDGRWRVREIAAHCAGWLGQFAAGMQRMSRGEKPSTHDIPWTEVDRWNEIFAEHAQGKRKDEVLHELEKAFASFKAAATQLPEDRFEEGKTVSKMFDLAGISHFKEHAEMIRGWQAGQRPR
jgi:hypothetical protein